MTRLVAPFSPRSGGKAGRQGYTLVEILTATALTLLMMTGVVTVLGTLSTSISSSRSGLEMMDRTRAAQRTLRRDLERVTATMQPPRSPEANEGYFEYIEGPVGPVPFPVAAPKPVNPEIPDDPATSLDESLDTTVGDLDDILMFTVRSPDVPFVGRYGITSLESRDAEIAYFVRGDTLYRRVLLVAPQTLNLLNTDDTDGLHAVNSADAMGSQSFFNAYDISARPVAYSGGETSWVPNSLADLTKRENRFAHRLHYTDSFPCSASRWGQLGLPTLQECSDAAWMTWPSAAGYPHLTNPVATIDFWLNPHPWVNASGNPQVDVTTGTFYDPDGTNAWDDLRGPRVGEDVILPNVIGFDVKAWDPQAPVLRSVHDANPATPSDLTDDASDGSVAVVPGDPGYGLALAHLIAELLKPPASRDPNYYPPLSYGAYADLGYGAASVPYGPGTAWTGSVFAARGNARSQLNPAAGPYTYDTWSTHYEHDGIDEDGNTLTDEGADGFDNEQNGRDDDNDGTIDEDDNGDGHVDEPGVGVVDDATEWETSPPYPVPLRGIQVKIRVFEPDGRQVREVTVVQDFLR